jgi:hypothetical protein
MIKKLEIWKEIKDFPDYAISNFGRVKSFKKYHGTNERILKQCKNNHGYLTIVLCKNKNHKTKNIHILLFEAFNDYKLNENECVHHKDSNKENNIFDNLQLMIKSEHHSLHNKGKNNPMFGIHRFGKNSPFFGKKHSKKNKIKMSENNKGEKHPKSKLSNQDVYNIRKSLELKLYTSKQLSWMFNIDLSTIYKIRNNKSWL